VYPSRPRYERKHRVDRHANGNRHPLSRPAQRERSVASGYISRKVHDVELLRGMRKLFMVDDSLQAVSACARNYERAIYLVIVGDRPGEPNYPVRPAFSATTAVRHSMFLCPFSGRPFGPPPITTLARTLFEINHAHVVARFA
jgi:hypothetical protein